MKRIDEIIAEHRASERDRSKSKDLPPYFEYALASVKEKGYFTAGGLDPDRILRPFDVTLHPLPAPHDAGMFHDHLFFEMAYVYRGSAVNKFRDYEVRLNEGDVLLLRPNSVHCLCTHDADDVVFNFLIPKDAFEAPFISRLSDSPVSNFLLDYFYEKGLSSDHLIVDAVPGSPLYEVLHRVISEFFDCGVGREIVLQAGLEQALVYLARNYSTQKNALPAPAQSPLVMKLVLYINRHYEDATLTGVARTFSYSEKYLSRVLKKELGMGFSELLSQTRMQNAAALLEKTNLPVADVAHSVGYRNLSHFYALFRASYGVKPADYRDRLQGKGTRPVQ